MSSVLTATRTPASKSFRIGCEPSVSTLPSIRFEVGGHALVRALEDVGDVVRGTINGGCPYVVAEFETHTPVFGRANKCRFEQLRPQLRIEISEMRARPGIHLVHRGELVIQRGK